jgi:hypothetical protein
VSVCGKHVSIMGGLVRGHCTLESGHSGVCSAAGSLASPPKQASWTPLDVARLLDALEAIADAQTAMANKTLVGSTAASDVAVRVRARYEKKSGV